jgi:hypothetical protein
MFRPEASRVCRRWLCAAFQMASSTYTSNLNAALQANPQLAGNIVPGLAGQDDPVLIGT